MLKILFSILLGVLLAFFIGLGIEAFYPTEKFPEAPLEIQYQKGEPTQAQLEKQKNYDLEIKAYQTRNEKHARNVSMIAISASIAFMILSLTILQKVENVFPDGFLIGSILTLLYGIIRGFESTDNKFRFLLVSIGLLAALILGYVKFIRKAKS